MPKYKVEFSETKYIEFEIDSDNYLTSSEDSLALVDFVNRLKEDPRNYYQQEKMMDPEPRPVTEIITIKEISEH